MSSSDSPAEIRDIVYPLKVPSLSVLIDPSVLQSPIKKKRNNFKSFVFFDPKSDKKSSNSNKNSETVNFRNTYFVILQKKN